MKMQITEKDLYRAIYFNIVTHIIFPQTHKERFLLLPFLNKFNQKSETEVQNMDEHIIDSFKGIIPVLIYMGYLEIYNAKTGGFINLQELCK